MALDGTYGGLKDSVAGFLNRSDLTSAIPDFCYLAHMEAASRVRHWRMLKRAYVTLDSEFTAYPSNFLEARRLYLTTTPPTKLDIITPDDALDRSVGYSAAGKPRYAAFGGSIQVVPAPGDSYTMNMLYYSAPDWFEENDEATNWLLTYFPSVYLYGALMQAAVYLHEDERVSLWSNLLERGFSSIRVDNASHEMSGGGGATPPMAF